MEELLRPLSFIFIVLAAASCDEYTPVSSPVLSLLERSSSDQYVDYHHFYLGQDASKIHGKEHTATTIVHASLLAREEGERAVGRLCQALISLESSSLSEEEKQAERIALLNALGETQSPLATSMLCSYVGLEAITDHEEQQKLKLAEHASLDKKQNRYAPIRQTAIAALGQVLHPSSVPTLITALQDAHQQTRGMAANVLRQVSNQNLGYEAIDPFETRRIAQARWHKWWEEKQQQPQDQWLIHGFNQAGYAIESFDSIPDLETLFAATEDGQVWIRRNAQRSLTQSVIRKQHPATEDDQQDQQRFTSFLLTQAEQAANEDKQAKAYTALNLCIKLLKLDIPFNSIDADAEEKNSDVIFNTIARIKTSLDQNQSTEEE